MGRAITNGLLNAYVIRATGQPLMLDKQEASQPPDEAAPDKSGNASCWGDNSRQDISCRPLTENLLFKLRGATKEEVIAAMGVKGREGDFLHFVSNYSRGERWGSGDVNFKFTADGRVNVIYALFDAPHGSGEHAEYIWNADLIPAGCSTLPGSHLQKCE